MLNISKCGCGLDIYLSISTGIFFLEHEEDENWDDSKAIAFLYLCSSGVIKGHPLTCKTEDSQLHTASLNQVERQKQERLSKSIYVCEWNTLVDRVELSNCSRTLCPLLKSQWTCRCRWTKNQNRNTIYIKPIPSRDPSSHLPSEESICLKIQNQSASHLITTQFVIERWSDR